QSKHIVSSLLRLHLLQRLPVILSSLFIHILQRCCCFGGITRLSQLICTIISSSHQRQFILKTTSFVHLFNRIYRLYHCFCLTFMKKHNFTCWIICTSACSPCNLNKCRFIKHIMTSI